MTSLEKYDACISPFKTNAYYTFSSPLIASESPAFLRPKQSVVSRPLPLGDFASFLIRPLRNVKREFINSEGYCPGIFALRVGSLI